MTYAAAAHTAFDQNLAMLDGLLAKAARHEAGDDLLAVRLAEDMLPLATQIRFVGHQVVNTLNLLAGGDYTLSETDPATLAQARAHITDLRAMMADHPAQDWAGSGEQVEFGPGARIHVRRASPRIHPRLGAAQFLFPRRHRLRHFAAPRSRHR